MSLSINDQDRQVAEVLKNIPHDCVFLGSFEKSDWKYDKWVFSLCGETFEYKTGIGHRIIKVWKPGKTSFYTSMKLTKKELLEVKNIRDLYGKNYKKNVVFEIGTGVFAVLPTQASILYCLLLDAEANDYSFNNWCDMFGYDNDSMKTFKTYQKCCETSQKLNKALSRDKIQQLKEILEDY